MQNFDDVQIDGAFVRELVMTTSKNLRMSLLRAPQKSERQVSILSELQFHEIQSVHFNFNAELCLRWLEPFDL